MAMVGSANTGSHGHRGHDHHGNPDDLRAYIEKMESPGRDEWQKPAEVLAALAVKQGDVVCDIGAGPGYFALKLARAVGDKGAVFAVDVEPRMLEVLRERIEKSGQRNVMPVLALDDDPLLPPASCDLVLIADTFHHFPVGAAYLERVARSLRKGGRIAGIDFHKRELPVGPPPKHKVSREEFLEHAALAGLELRAEHHFLPYQYFLVFEPRQRAP